jgi:branched-chain amino acid transport system ATP-binding protein
MSDQNPTDPQDTGDDVGGDVSDVVGDDVQWYLDDDGTEWFAEDDVRFELAEDGFAYPVVGGTTDPTGAKPLDVLPHEPAAGSGGDDATAPVGSNDVDVHDADDTAGDAAASDASTAAVSSKLIRISVDGDGAAAEVDVTAVAVAPVVAVEAQAPTRPSSSTGDGTTSLPRIELEQPAFAATGTDAGTTEPLLSIRALDAGYGSLPVLKHVDLEIQAGQTAVLLGLNGAGKTTTAWTVCGALAPWSGQIMFDGVDVGGWSTGKAVSNGVVMVPEGRRVFPDLSVARNLQVGAWMKRGDREFVHAQRERVFDYFPRLREREEQLAGTLSGGEQQMLAIARGIMSDPRLLIIDEASMGLAPVIVKDVFDIIAQINKDGVTVLLIEQNVGALDVADVGYVMEQGRMIKTLEGEELRDRSVVSAALMG